MTLRPNTRLALLLSSILAAGCARGPAPDGSGTIECTQVRLAAEVGGRLSELPVSEGQSIQASQVVARIDPVSYILKRDEATAALAQAQAQLDLMLAGSRDEDIQRAREQLRESRASALAATADVARVEEVFAAGSATAKQRDDARAAAERTAALAAAAEQQLARVLSGSRKEEIRAAQAAVDLARARLSQAEKAVADCTVHSPIAGTIAAKSAEQGEVVAAGTALATVSRLDEVWLSVYIPETQLRRVRLGQPAWVCADGSPQRYAGTVTFVASEAEFTPRNAQTRDERAKLVYRVKITLPNPNGVFKPGMPADGYMETTKAE